MLDGMRQTLVERDGFGPVVIAAADDNVGIVTVHDGPSLPPGEIIAPEVGADLANSEIFTKISRSRKSSCERVAIAAGSFRCCRGTI